MDAYRFARVEGGGSNGGKFGFSIDRGRTVAALRELADRIESSEREGAPHSPGDILLQRVSAKSIADLDEFTQTEITIVFVEVQ